uniref:ATP synthase F0 subunit 8 n=1 Tax=Abrus daozhenensis TaxID=2959344 RepID=UPI00211470A9|nr:ATP synthase F0 subunit 8 [Abrus daozhenensis]USS62515.1 ATP synthase F0 subunit 8 [Abrus daozhenensis]
MPQMAPMWWTFIMVLSTTTLLLMMILTFFNFKNKIKIFYKKNSTKMNWSW